MHLVALPHYLRSELDLYFYALRFLTTNTPTHNSMDEIKRLREDRQKPFFEDDDAVMADVSEMQALNDDERQNLPQDSYTAPQEFLNETVSLQAVDELQANESNKSIYNRANDYKRKRLDRQEADDDEKDLSYKERLALRDLERDEKRVQEAIRKKEEANGTSQKEQDELRKFERAQTPPRVGPRVRKGRSDKPVTEDSGERGRKRKSRWDVPDEKEAETSTTSKITDEFLASVLPSEGYTVLTPPASYKPLIKSKVTVKIEGYSIPGGSTETAVDRALAIQAAVPSADAIPGVGDLAYFKESDMKYFGALIKQQDAEEQGLLSAREMKERQVMRLILKIKNGSPQMRKQAMRQLTDSARSLGPEALFSQIIPLFRERSLEDTERHWLVKVVDRVLFKLGDLVRPYTPRLLSVIEPLLIDEDYFTRVEGRELVANISKAAGLPHMISTLRPNVGHADEFVRNTTARSFAIVASALGVPALVPFIKAVCKSKKSWEARHTGAKIVQQIAILIGCTVLPYLGSLVDCIGDGLTDDNPKVRQMTAQALAALAEAAAPYGIESFENVLEPLWLGVREQRGKHLVAFLKAIGYIIPLMNPDYADYYTKEVMAVVLREFYSPDEEMKRVVLEVVTQCARSEGVTARYIRVEVLPTYFKCFWTRRMASDRVCYKLILSTTVELANKVGTAEIVDRVANHLKDESDHFRRLTMETIDKVVANLGIADIEAGSKLETRLVDGILTAFQLQSPAANANRADSIVMLRGFGTVIQALDTRAAPYFSQITSSVLFRLSNKSPIVRSQAADLIGQIAGVMKNCGEDEALNKLGQILYEQLGEEYPEALGSLLGALKAIVAVVGLASMTPPIRDLLPRLTPILRNRHEKVQENTIDLVGRIADRGPEYVSAREWMRICFELIDLLKAHKKTIQKAANNTFGYIAKAIGPQDVLATLLSNLRVQERQSRVCTAVAIGIVAETCSPFTVLPALMNEYRVPEINVQNGVLKAMTFMFEYIGDMAKDYIYAVAPLLEDALTDRDHVHRQTAATVVRHLAINCVGLGAEDAMVHFLNLLIPNIYETSPHVIVRILDAIEGIRLCLGPGLVLNYIWAGLFHAARKVRDPFWKAYNSAYIDNVDAMTPYYPDMPEDDEFYRHELDLWV
jgi:splicing factor 3B subunit 1